MTEENKLLIQELKDNWLWEEAAWTSGKANHYWMWCNVCQDEINHCGEISWLKSHIPA